jgi:4-hydroxy-3-polyprenylbenzoate decarboxylase
MNNLPLVVGISGASGVIYGIRILEVLKDLGIDSHLIMTEAARLNLKIETEYHLNDVLALATRVYEINNMAASVSSGSFKTAGMIVAPCSVKTLSAIANSFDYNLLIRAADVTLKERRRLVLMVRETPLHGGHLDLMARASKLGAIILPPVPAFYTRPRTIQEIIDQSIGKALDGFHIEHNLFKRWS